jgi:hypothetical protein
MWFLKKIYEAIFYKRAFGQGGLKITHTPKQIKHTDISIKDKLIKNSIN